MKFRMSSRASVCAAALLIAAAGAVAVRAQDAQAPAEQPAAAAPAPAAAAPAPARNPTDVVARVADETITEAEVQIASKQFSSELAQVPPEQQRGLVVDALVNMHLIAQAARDAKIDQQPEFEAQRSFIEMQALRNIYVEQVVVGSLTPEEVQKGYDDLIVKVHKPEEQVRARHILVETKEQAEKIIADLKGGASFEELAKQSKDPSGQNGGDLGYFGAGQMVPAFEKAAFAMQPGQISDAPVQTEFGWHVIRLEDKRMSAPQPLAEVEGELRNHLMRGKFEGMMADLRKKYTIEIVGQPAPGQNAAPTGEQGAAPDAGGAAAPAAGEAPAGGEPPASGAQPQN